MFVGGEKWEMPGACLQRDRLFEIPYKKKKREGKQVQGE